ncbi:MAG: hypothetical protein ACKPKO_07760 [Candidatus Fonsibacter sp.]
MRKRFDFAENDPAENADADIPLTILEITSSKHRYLPPHELPQCREYQ